MGGSYGGFMVLAAVKKVIAMGVADPARIGTIGHSWGGFDSAYLATHSTMFAASIAGGLAAVRTVRR